MDTDCLAATARPPRCAGTVFRHVGIPALDISFDLVPGEWRQLGGSEALGQAPARIVTIGVGAACHNYATSGKAICPVFDNALQDDPIICFVYFVQSVQNQQAAMCWHVGLSKIGFQVIGQVAGGSLDILEETLGRAFR